MRLRHSEDYRALMRDDLPERLRAITIDHFATDNAWKPWPARNSTPSVSADVLFVSYSAHQDMLKQCIALKRERPDIKCALAVNRHAHTQRLCERWFDEIVVTGAHGSGHGGYGNHAALMRILRNANAKVVILRHRDVTFNTCARLFRHGPLIYSPPGFYMSSVADDPSYLAVLLGQVARSGDPEQTFATAFEADKFLLEHVDGIIHFISDAAFEWFRCKGVNIRCPAATVYVACMPELEPPIKLKKLSDNDGEWHIVHATGVPQVWRTPRMGRDAFLSLVKCETVVRQGIHLHIYGTYFDRNLPGYAPYVDLARRSPYFHIEEQLEFEDLLVAMTQYDYAWKHWDISDIAVWPIHKQGLTPNFYAYIQSGLPLLISPLALPDEVRMAREHGIGLFVDEGDLLNLRQILEENRQNLIQMQQCVQKAKDGVFSYDSRSLLEVIDPYLTNRTPQICISNF